MDRVDKPINILGPVIYDSRITINVMFESGVTVKFYFFIKDNDRPLILSIKSMVSKHTFYKPTNIFMF